MKNIRVKETKNCEKFPLFRAFKEQTKKVKEMSETAIFFHAANFFAIIVNY